MRRTRISLAGRLLGLWLAGCMVATLARADNRTINGTGNNIGNPNWGAANIQLLRIAPSDYDDDVWIPAGASRPSAREISNMVSAQSSLHFDERLLSDFAWQWGQFVDHDIDLTEGHTPTEAFNIDVPMADPFFDPFNTGTEQIPLNRSHYDTATGLGIGNPREQMNGITSWIDASNVYGSDSTRADALRGADGLLLTSTGDLLPFNTPLLPNANAGPIPDDQLFLSGDVRANEQIALTAMHTLFMREHNRLATQLAIDNPLWTDDQVYERARKMVGAEIQAITYNEFLPALLGPYAGALTGSYSSSIDASVANLFSTATYRMGHSMLSSTLLRVQDDGTPAPGGDLPLQDAFFNPTLLSSSSDLDYLLKGLASQRMQTIDTEMVDDVRNYLFGPPGAGGFDLAALNIQRGRDHGLPDYNATRAAYGLAPVDDWMDITDDVTLQGKLQSLYGSVDDIDLWVGVLAEKHLPGASVGELTMTSLVEQFLRLRNGDRYFYLWDTDFTQADKDAISATRLSDIIVWNTGITNIQKNVFFAIPEPTTAVLLALGSLAVLTVRRRTARRRASA